MSEVASEELIPLDTVATESEVVILPDFPALVEGRRVWVTAVLERTAVVEPSPGEPKVLVNREAARRNREAAQAARRRAA
jgi:hypothetical protein